MGKISPKDELRKKKSVIHTIGKRSVFMVYIALLQINKKIPTTQ